MSVSLRRATCSLVRLAPVLVFGTLLNIFSVHAEAQATFEFASRSSTKLSSEIEGAPSKLRVSKQLIEPHPCWDKCLRDTFCRSPFALFGLQAAWTGDLLADTRCVLQGTVFRYPL